MIFIANWKMNGSAQLVEAYKEAKLDVIVCPPFTFLHHFQTLPCHPERSREATKLKDPENAFRDPSPLAQDDIMADIKLGAQNCSEHKSGSYTGEISAPMLKEAGCSYIIIGHSERRKFETQEVVIEKAKRVIEQNMIPIICCEDYVEINLDPSKFWMAYEPLWAIGTGKTPTPDHIHEMTQRLKKNCPTVLYGGSVNAKNASFFKEVCDGFLIGGASLNIDEMEQIVAIYT